jgi:hypothetical protein
MSHRKSFLRSASYCLSAALLLTLATSADTFAAPPDQAQGEGKPVAKKVIQIESMGARAFAGTNLYNPAVPSGSRYLPCDHGYVDWQIPPGARAHSLVFTHGSGTRGYQTTFDGKPGFQSIFLGEKYPVYLVDFPRTGRAGQGCAEYTYTPNLNYTSVFLWIQAAHVTPRGIFPPLSRSQRRSLKFRTGLTREEVYLIQRQGAHRIFCCREEVLSEANGLSG